MSTAIEEGRDEEEEDEGINLELRPEYQRSLQRRRLNATVALAIGCIILATTVLLKGGSGGRNGNRHDGGDDDDIFSRSKDLVIDDDAFDDDGGLDESKDWGDGSFTVLDHVELMQDSDDCNSMMDYCNGAISALVIAGSGEIVIAGFPAHSRPRTSESVGEKAGWRVGLVRVFAYSCEYNSYRKLGPDLSPLNPEAVGDLFGTSVVASRDGRVLAIGAKVDNHLDWARTEEDATLVPYVAVHRLVDDGVSQRWEQRGETITGQWQAPGKDSGEKGVA
eukprot:scaffold3440_cov120-Skeletonema_marinoi.AAC.4